MFFKFYQKERKTTILLNFIIINVKFVSKFTPIVVYNN